MHNKPMTHPKRQQHTRTYRRIHIHTWFASFCGALLLNACDGDAKATQPPKPLIINETKLGSPGLPQGKAAKPAPLMPKMAAPLPVLLGDHFPVFDLLHNRPLAHRIERTETQVRLAAQASGLEFLRYINANYPKDWMTDVTIDQVHASAVKGRIAKLFVPAFRPAQAQLLELRVFNPAKGNNSLKVEVNKNTHDAIALKQGWQDVRLSLPAREVRGENTFKLTFSNMGRINKNLSGGALAWLKLGPGKVDAKTALVRPVKPALASKDPLFLKKNQGLAWHLWALPQSKISLELDGVEGCGVHLEVFTQDVAGTQISSLKTTRRLVKGRGKTQPTMLDLSSIAGEKGQAVRLEVVGDEACKDSSLRIHKASLVVPGKRPKRPDFVRPKHVLFWMIDTLRADYLKAYNAKTNVETPALDAIIKDGALFKLAFVQGNESKVSHGSLFSALYPNRHGLGAKGKLKSELLLMPEAIQKLGYRTGAHIANGYISEPWGFVQGWNHYKNNLRQGGGITGMALAQNGITWAKANKDKNFFLYLGTIDPHVTYRAHAGIIEKYDTTPYSGSYRGSLSGKTLGKIRGGSVKVSERDRLRIKNLYKNEITYNDQAFAKVRAAFEEMGIWKDTMVVVTADHGDEFWEHGSVGHGHNIHQELVHVPLLMYYPPMIKAGLEVEAGVDILDVYPTIVDALGGTRPKNLQGKSLLPLLYKMHGGYPEPAIATRYLGHYTMQMQQWKLYLRKGDYQFFDRSKDPQELDNVRGKNPVVERWLLDALTVFRAHRKNWDKLSWGVPSNLSAGFGRGYHLGKK